MKNIRSIYKRVLLFLFYSSILCSYQNFAQTPTLATLLISNSTIPVNGTVDITIHNAQRPTNAEDWVGLYEESTVPGQGKPSIWWDYVLNLGVTDGNGSFTFNPAKIPRTQLRRYTAGKTYKFILAYKGSYIVAASINFNVIAKQNPAITSFNPVVIKTNAGITPKLPLQIIANYNNGTNKKVKVIWSNIDPSLYKQAGSFTIKGVVTVTGVVPKADINVTEGNGPVLSFQVISDTHIRKNNPRDVYNRYLTAALYDMNQINPNSNAIVVVGDITDNGRSAQYDQFNTILRTVPHAKTYFVLGNHDLYSSPNYQSALNLFKIKTGMSGAYYDTWINGYHFIMLGSEAKAGNRAVISKKQLFWFKQRLADNANPKKPIFVFLHQPLSDTVSGSDRMKDVKQDKQIKSILAQFPQTILMTGHTHSVLTESTQFFTQQYCNMVNTAAVAYLWYDPTYSRVRNGSQGLYIDVYPNKVVIKGRDFIRREWIVQKTFAY